jgi:hypothetical protein
LEDYKLKKDQEMVETKEKMTDQDPTSEEDEESSLDVKDGLQDGLEVGDDGKTPMSPPKEGKERFYKSPSVEGNSHIAAPCSPLRPYIPPVEIGIPRIDFDGPFTTKLRDDYRMPEVAPCSVRLSIRATEVDPFTMVLLCLNHPASDAIPCPSAAAPAPHTDFTMEKRKKSQLLNSTANHRPPTMTCVLVPAPLAKDTTVEGEEEGGLVEKEDLGCSEMRISLEDIMEDVVEDSKKDLVVDPAGPDIEMDDESPLDAEDGFEEGLEAGDDEEEKEEDSLRILLGQKQLDLFPRSGSPSYPLHRVRYSPRGSCRLRHYNHLRHRYKYSPWYDHRCCHESRSRACDFARS